MELLSFLSTISCIILASLEASMALDSTIQSQSISLNQTLISKSERFELGFFNPGNSEQTYLGIWYHKIPVKTVVWVANRLKPINGSSGSAILTLNSSGNLVLSLNGTVLWHTSSANQAKNPVAELLDSGNLVVRDDKEANPEAYLWQSFDYPTDTLLPEMKFGWDLKKGLNRHLIAWKSPEDPSPGDFSGSIELYNYPDSVMWKGKRKYYRMGAWNGLYPSGAPAIRSNSVFDDKYVSNKNEIYYMYSLKNNSLIIRFVMNQTDYTFYCNIWIEAEQNWSVCGSSPRDICDHFGQCGVYAICSTGETPSCQCLSRFRPKSPQIWNSMDWTQGCVRNTPLSCEDKHKDGFFKMVGLKLPDTEHSWLDETISIEECRERCLNNCSCMAYTSSNVSDGSGCSMWFDELIDIKLLTDSGQYLYIRMPASELEEVEHGLRKKLALTIATTTIVAISGMLLVMCCYIHNVRRKMTEKLQNLKEFEDELDEDLPFHDLPTISAATNNFSPLNKIGEGGFGPVYKGRLNGQEIAVKRLSRSSRQGMTEFKNEVKLIAKLQHRNLVKLLGCCIQGEEKILLYEFMPNSSLDSFIFDHTKAKLLDWATRYHIICGIARGLLYLHQDSILKIIHRDLKASNILLDDKLHPKISDFGLARIFGGDQTDANTSRIVGTYGYMAPEYTADGLFSVKSDVFSFGILLLEIICGMRNRGFYRQDGSLNLIGHAWRLWKEGTAMELIDPNIKDSCIVSEVMRCMHVSLLCVQHYPENRPIMPSVVLMLESEIELTEPREPGFFPRKVSDESQTSPIEKKLTSTNELSITQLDAR